MGLEDLLDAVCRAARDVGDLGVGRRRQGTEQQRVVRSPADVDTVKREHVGVYVEQQGFTIPCRRKSRSTTGSTRLRGWRWRSSRCRGVSSFPSRSAVQMASI